VGARTRVSTERDDSKTAAIGLSTTIGPKARSKVQRDYRLLRLSDLCMGLIISTFFLATLLIYVWV